MNISSGASAAESPRGGRARGRSRPERAEVREALLDAAFLEFAEVGYGAASVESIAERAGLTKGAVYGNFDGKFGLFLGLIVPERMVRLGFLDWVGGDPGDPEASLKRLAEAVHLRSQQLMPNLVVAEARGYAARSPELAVELARARTAVVEHLAPLVADELDRIGLVALAPMSEVVYALLALVNGIAFEQVGVEEPVLPVELVERMVRSLITVGPG